LLVGVRVDPHLERVEGGFRQRSVEPRGECRISRVRRGEDLRDPFGVPLVQRDEVFESGSLRTIARREMIERRRQVDLDRRVRSEGLLLGSQEVLATQ
jgi:hypothetical protein